MDGYHQPITLENAVFEAQANYSDRNPSSQAAFARAQLSPPVSPIRNPADAACDSRLRDLFFFDMAEAGTYIGRRGLIALMRPAGDAEIEHVVEAVGSFLSRRHDLLAA